MKGADPNPVRGFSNNGIPRDGPFGLSAYAFRIGLALVTFEQIRPAGIMLSDYFFFLSILAIFPSFSTRLKELKNSGILLTAILIGGGSILSLINDADFTNLGSTFARLFILYGLFAPLAVIHCKNIRTNILFLIAGISVNCAIAILQASLFPGIAEVLAVNPQTSDQSEIFRYQGLTEFPVTLGLAAALALLMGVGLLTFEKRPRIRLALILLLFVCLQGAFLSGSRTFLAALVPALLVFGLLQNQRRRIVLRGLVAILVLTALTFLVPGAQSQFASRLGEVGVVDIGRIAVALNALVEIFQRPLLGWGANHFAEAGLTQFPSFLGYGTEPLAAHVTLLQYWYGGGLLAAIGFIVLFLIPIKNMITVLKRPRSSFTNAVRLILSSYICIFVIVNLGPYLYNRYLYIPMFTFAGFTAVALRYTEMSSR